MTVLLHTNNLLSDEVKGKIAERNCHPFCISKTFNQSLLYWYKCQQFPPLLPPWLPSNKPWPIYCYRQYVNNDDWKHKHTELDKLLLQKRFSVSMQYSIFYDIFQLERSILVLSYIPVHTYLESFNKGICLGLSFSKCPLLKVNTHSVIM